jgi:flagellar export protein FliJ
MPPKFTLQNLLDYHHSRVELFEVELGKLYHSHLEVTGQIDQLHSEQERLFVELKETQSGELDLQKISLTRSNIRNVQENIARHKKLLQMLEEAIEIKKAELIEVKQDEAVFEKLKEKELDRFNEKQMAIEKVLQDDIYTSKAHRQKEFGIQEELM